MAKNTNSRKPRKGTAGTTMAAVAELAGVSTMTVSNVLNNKPSVQPAKREAVLKAIAALDYRPNSAARALASAASLRIGLLHRDVDSALLSAMLVGALKATSRLGVQLIINSYDDADPLPDVEAFLRSGLDGLLLPPPLCEIVSASGLPETSGTAMIALAPGAELPNMPGVRIDDERAARDITRILLQTGHRRIGFVRLPGSLVGQTRVAGYLAALAEFGVEPDPALVWDARPTFAAGLALAERILAPDAPDHRPTAVIAGNDDMAAAFVNVALRSGLAVPQDISIIGFDDTPIAVKIWPALTTVRQPLARIAQEATERLVEALRKDAPLRSDNVTSYVDFTIVDRASVGSAP